jgi:hypothetical protein
MFHDKPLRQVNDVLSTLSNRTPDGG